MLDDVVFCNLARQLRIGMAGQVLENVNLASFSRWKIGGVVSLLVLPATVEDVVYALSLMSHVDCPKVVIGDGSNLLFDSDGIRGIVIRIGDSLSRYWISDTKVWAEAGIWVPNLVRAVGSAGLTGLEHAIGIPGTLGGLVLMNGGSQRKGVGASVESVRCVDFDGNLYQVAKDECQFSYRYSTLQARSLIILDCCLSLERGDVGQIRREMIDIMASRRAKFPKNFPNCGSVFLSDPAMYEIIGAPGLAIERVGLKGVRFGDAQISDLHANFIVNLGSATSDDVLWLINEMRNRVYEQTGFCMNTEVRYVAPDGEVRMAHEPAAERWGAKEQGYSS